jgi:hypothetical protein
MVASLIDSDAPHGAARDLHKSTIVICQPSG